MRLNKIISFGLLWVSLLGFSSLTFAQEDLNAYFIQANALYNEGKYDSALVTYNQILDQEMASAALYYNVGNTYYKLREYPMAILNYEKALQLDPNNEDIRTNLQIANLKVVDKIEPVPTLFFVKWWNNLRMLFSANAWAAVSLGLFALLLLCIFLFFTSRSTGLRKTGFFTGLIVLLLLVVSVLFSVQKYNGLRHQDEAIVMTPTITVKSSPSESSVDLFVLHEGAKVAILDVANDWNKVKIANGSVGWLPSNSMISY